MFGYKSAFVAAVILIFGNTVLAQNTPADDPNLSPAQRKYLKQFQADLENRPINATASDQYLTKVQGSLKQLFAANNTPSADCSNVLATTLYNGLNNGQITVQTSVLLSKEISKALGAKQLTYQNVNEFTKTIDPLVRQTKLGPTEQLKLYRDVLIILKSVPNYVPESR